MSGEQKHDPMTPYEISPANEGGFYVSRGRNHPAHMPVITFAGTLDQCLDFLRERMTPPLTEDELVAADRAQAAWNASGRNYDRMRAILADQKRQAGVISEAERDQAAKDEAGFIADPLVNSRDRDPMRPTKFSDVAEKYTRRGAINP